MSKEKLGTLVALVSGISFATLAIFSKSAYNGGANVPTVLFLRFTGAAFLFWLYHKIKPPKVQYEQNTKIKLFIMGALGYGTMSAFFLFSVSRIPASMAGMLLYLYPAFVAIVSVILKHEKFSRKIAVALVATFIGIFLVLGVSFESLDMIGVIAGLCAPCVYTVYIVGGSGVLKDVEAISATMYIMFGAAFTYITYVTFSGTLSLAFSPFTWFTAVGFVLISTVLAITSFWHSVKLIGPTKTSIISSVEPLATVLMAYFAFGETLNLQQAVGGFMIILGVFILQYQVENENKNEMTSRSS